MARTIEEVFNAHKGRLVDKWRHYFPIYQEYFAKYVGTPVRVLEIGVSHGGSLQLWRDYFGPLSWVDGIDIEPKCREYGDVRQVVFTVDQSDSAQMTAFAAQWGSWDIIIDDGSHIKEHQQISFNALWPRCRGVYLIEDCHSGYPQIGAPEALCTYYPWLLVVERAKRIIRGVPSRPLRQDEMEAMEKYGC